MRTFLVGVLPALFFGGMIWMLAKIIGVNHPFGGGELNDPRVEWSIDERTSIIGDTEWVWHVRVGDKSESNDDFTKAGAMTHARASARRLLGQGEHLGRTRPCSLCGKPSRIGQETDTEECALLLKKARTELSELG